MHALIVSTLALIGYPQSSGQGAQMTREQASAFAKLALKGIHKEYPNKPGDVLNGDEDVKPPRVLHPAFYGCFDWHSSVHGHWMLVRLLRTFPDLPEAKQIRAVLAEHLTAKNLQAEADYFAQPNRKSFERPYGWAWLLKLAEELHGWDDADAQSLVEEPASRWPTCIVARYLAYLPEADLPDPQRRPSEHGVRPGVRPRLRPHRRRQAAARR